ncbi:MAG: tryptophan 2,3-dioxygenase family protein [Thermoanaerobaculia bacterium]|nr:tryptophan 2,3-dioxygenase family protein [Thermoanaerobaculia bacterium]
MPIPDSTRKALTYTSYLRLDDLLDLQQPVSDEHDEMLFIVIHQVYELWFKQMLYEVRALQTHLEAAALGTSLASFKRILTILKLLVAQVDILETMTPVSFLSFRSRLESASGFQSAQFRQLEFLLGRKNRGLIEHHPEGSPGRRAIEAAYEAPTLWDSFVRFVAACGYDVPAALLERDVTRPIETDETLQEALLAMYREDGLENSVCERMVDLDEGLQEWRYRHVKMVERTIGHKRGTGGSEGAGYLRTTLFEPLFPDLWEIRTRL